MNLICRLFDHRQGLPETHNHGLVFTTCRRCGVDMVRERGAAWRAVPPGFRVVWKAHGRHDATPGGNAVGLIKSGFLSAAPDDPAPPG